MSSVPPLAGLIGQATEQLAARNGSTVGGLPNATFGNATELIVAFFARSAGKETDEEKSHGRLWSPLLVGFMSEFLVGFLEGFTAAFGLSEFFVGLIITPIVGNAAEHASAVVFALEDRTGLGVTIALGSTVQVALLVAPLLVILSFVIGKSVDLVLNNSLELVALIGAVLFANSVAHDGKENWLEGFMLLGAYLILGIAFFLPSP